MQLTVFILFMVALLSCRTRAPDAAVEAVGVMAKYHQQGRHDDAIKIGQDWINRHPNDTAHKAVMYEQIGLAYLLKASKDASNKEEWIQQAVYYYDQDISLRPKDSFNIDFYNAGRGFEMAADLSAVNKCSYYERAVKAFVEQVPFIQGESYTAYGKTTPLEPVRQENEKALGRVRMKAAEAACKTGTVNGGLQQPH